MVEEDKVEESSKTKKNHRSAIKSKKNGSNALKILNRKIHEQLKLGFKKFKKLETMKKQSNKGHNIL